MDNPITPQETQDPTWWRLGCVPFIVLILSLVGLDLAWPEHFDAGVGTGIGCALWCLAILLLRRDFSRGEFCFLAAFAVITFVALLVSGSLLNWVLAFFVPLVLLSFPRQGEPHSGSYHSWWGYWFARRKALPKSRWSFLRQILPFLITLLVGVNFFLIFLIIFASGNPVVLLVWNSLCDGWNALVAWLELDWGLMGRLLVWFFAFFLFGLYTFERPLAVAPLPQQPAAVKPGNSLLPRLPLASLLGVNLAFGVATSTDIAYLWLGRAPEGVSQTAYLHDGALSIIWAAVLASLLLVFLFRQRGTARQGRSTRALGCLLAFQTFLLAVSVYVRLFHQVDDFGLTPRRIQAAEALLLGLVGLVILVCYMLCSGSFWKYTRICLGSMLLMLISFGICPPAELAGNLNLRYAASHPQWKFCTEEFKPGCFAIEDNLAFALYVQEHASLPHEGFSKRLMDAALRVERRAGYEGWRHWNVGFERDIPAAEKILGRPIVKKEVEPIH